MFKEMILSQYVANVSDVMKGKSIKDNIVEKLYDICKDFNLIMIGLTFHYHLPILNKLIEE